MDLYLKINITNIKGVIYMSNYYFKPVVGIDISQGFHVVSILNPMSKLHTKTFKIYNTLDGFSYLLSQIEKVEREYNMKTAIFMESTGVYHLSLFHFLKKQNLEVNLINPLVTNSNKNKDIRKVKNDKKDSFSIAKLAQLDDIKYSDYFDLHVFNAKSLCREYYKHVDTRSSYKRKLSADIHVLFPNYNSVFKNTTCDTSIVLLKKYPTPSELLAADSETVVQLIKATSKKGLNWATNIYNKLKNVALDAIEIGIPSISLELRISLNLNIIETLDKNLKTILNEIKNIVNSNDFPQYLKDCIEFVDSIPGFDFFSAITILAEIGDYRRFKKPKQLIAFLGLDPGVNQSGKFKGDKNSMSKRGSKAARRTLYSAALVSIRKKRSGEYFNPVLFTYFHENLINKKPKIALGAIMHKLVNYIFSVLRDQKNYELRSPKLHNQMFLNNKSKQCA